MATESRRRSRRMDLRTTPEERELIDWAAAAAGTDLTEFVVTHDCEAALRVLGGGRRDSGLCGHRGWERRWRRRLGADRDRCGAGSDAAGGPGGIPSRSRSDVGPCWSMPSPRKPVTSMCNLVPDFEVSPTEELHLVLLMKDIRRTLGAGT